MQAMRSKIIDDRGTWWDAGARELRAALRLDDIQGDICTVLINNLGFIGVSLRHAGVIIRFRPRTVSRAALGALIYWLTRHCGERICVSFPMDGQQQPQEILPSPRTAVLRMEALVELELGSSTVPSFVARMGALSRLEHGSCFSVLLD